MPRTVVHPVVVRGAGGEPAGGDPLGERLIKYVPAETLAFLVPVAATVGADRDALLVAVLAVGLVGTLGYLWRRHGGEDPRHALSRGSRWSARCSG